jgi:hypothetical protein
MARIPRIIGVNLGYVRQKKGNQVLSSVTQNSIAESEFLKSRSPFQNRPGLANLRLARYNFLSRNDMRSLLMFTEVRYADLHLPV